MFRGRVWIRLGAGLICCIVFFSFCTKSSADLNVRKKTFVILGSSTAQGAGAAPLDSSWARKVLFRLRKDGINSDDVNLAFSGFRTYDVLPSSVYPGTDTDRNVDKALTYNPDLVIISMPSNDFATGSTDAQILNNFKIITEKIQSFHVPFIVLSTQPRNFASYFLRKRLSLFNNLLDSTFTYHFINVYPELATDSFYQKPEMAYGDGIHLNNRGHDWIYNKIVNDSVFRKVFY